MVRNFIGALLFSFALACACIEAKSANASEGASAAAPVESQDITDKIVGDWESYDSSIVNFFEKYGSAYKFLFSFEDNAPMDNSFEKRRIAISMKNASLKQVLAKIVEANPDLRWELNDNVINMMRGDLNKDKRWELNYVAPKVDITANPELLGSVFKKEDILQELNPMVMFDPESIDKRTQRFKSPELTIKERNKSVRTLLNIYLNAYREAGYISYWSYVQSYNGKYRLSVLKIGEIKKPAVKAASK